MTADGTRHPYEYELADYVDGRLNGGDRERISGHLRTCPACRAVLDQFADEPGPDMQSELELPRRAVLPSSIRDALLEHRVAPPRAGQVWRLRGTRSDIAEELIDLAVVLRVGEELLVAPVTTDSREATDLWTLQTSLDGLTVAAWVSLQAPMGYEVLDVLLGQVDDAALLDVHRAFRRGEQPPRNLPLGRHLDDELRVHRDRVKASFVALSEIRVDEASLQEVADGVGKSVSLGRQLQEGGWDVISLAKAAGISPKQARNVLGGTADLTREERQQIGIAQGSAGPAPRLDPGWVRAVAGPELRPRYEREAGRRHIDPWVFREQCLREPVAARGNRGAVQDWFELAQQQLQRLEAEEVPEV